MQSRGKGGIAAPPPYASVLLGLRLGLRLGCLFGLVCPDVASRMTFDKDREPDVLLNKGEVIIPEKLAKGLKLKIGDPIVLVANNKDGSVNGLNFKIAGITASSPNLPTAQTASNLTK